MELVSTLRGASVFLKILMGLLILTSIVGFIGFAIGEKGMLFLVFCLPGAISSYFGSLLFTGIAQILENQEALKTQTEEAAYEE